MNDASTCTHAWEQLTFAKLQAAGLPLSTMRRNGGPWGTSWCPLCKSVKSATGPAASSTPTLAEEIGEHVARDLDRVRKPGP